MNIPFYLIISVVIFYFYQKDRPSPDFGHAAGNSLLKLFIAVGWVAFTLIWGGIFWW